MRDVPVGEVGVVLVLLGLGVLLVWGGLIVRVAAAQLAARPDDPIPPPVIGPDGAPLPNAGDTDKRHQWPRRMMW